ncbi:MAG TPA: NUMOD3 domain-containing DNA-binding protein [Nitrososphaeraceae archaeon]|nr:NUMOD3 domain-containing DNA-binding protein [Nitrososphaeraceae archaeon]
MVFQKGSLHPLFKGDYVGKHALHDFVRKRLPIPALCEICNIVPPRDLANVTGKYHRELSNWKYLCRGCHMKLDYSTGIRQGPLFTEEHRLNLSVSHRGYKHSEETKKKMSESHKGQNAWNKGISPSEITRLKLSQALKGKIVSEETKLKIGLAKKGNQYCKGRKHSEETKRKISLMRRVNYLKNKQGGLRYA